MLRGLLTDDEWGFFEPFVVESGPSRGRPPSGHRRVLDAIFWVARPGIPWRDLPPELGHWNSVHRQYRRWTTSGLWDVLLQALTDGGGDADALQMIDSTIIRARHCIIRAHHCIIRAHHCIIRAHRCTAGAKGGLTARILGARAVASRPRSISAATPMAYRLA